MKKHIFYLATLLILSAFPAMAQKYAYVNTDYILDNVPDYKESQKSLDALSVNWQKEIENKYGEIDKMYKSYQAEQILLTEDMKKKREQEIVLKEKEVKDLQKQRFGQGGDLFKRRQELVKPIQDKVYNAVKKMASEGNFMVIFDKSSESLTMLYTNPKYDKSDDVLLLMGIKPGPKQAAKPAGDSKSGGSPNKSSDGRPPLDSKPTQDSQPSEKK